MNKLVTASADIEAVCIYKVDLVSSDIVPINLFDDLLLDVISIEGYITVSSSTIYKRFPNLYIVGKVQVPRTHLSYLDTIKVRLKTRLSNSKMTALHMLFGTLDMLVTSSTIAKPFNINSDIKENY